MRGSKQVDRALSIILTRGGVALSDTERKALELREIKLATSTDSNEIAYYLGIVGTDGAVRQAND